MRAHAVKLRAHEVLAPGSDVLSHAIATPPQPSARALPETIPVLYADASPGLGGASICLAEMLRCLEGVRPIVQHALPRDLADLYGPWETAEAVPWNAESYVAWAEPDARAAAGLAAKALRLCRRVWRHI